MTWTEKEPMGAARHQVIRWATGNTGQRSLREVIREPALDLVGVRVYASAKERVNAGELCPKSTCPPRELDDGVRSTLTQRFAASASTCNSRGNATAGALIYLSKLRITASPLLSCGEPQSPDNKSGNWWTPVFCAGEYFLFPGTS
jgi:hypothetical protein